MVGVKAAAKVKPEDCSPECQLGMCSLCPGDGVAVYAPGRRRAWEAPLFTYRCAHGCRHGGRAVVPSVPADDWFTRGWASS